MYRKLNFKSFLVTRNSQSKLDQFPNISLRRLLNRRKMGTSNKDVLHLPVSKGPFVPGCMDVMLDYSKSGLFMRMYYPTKVKPEEVSHKQWPTWFPDDNYLIGIAKALYAIPQGLRLVQWWYSGDKMLIPALYGEKIHTDKKLKCIILSHGYVSNRFLYSIICNDLAAQGYLAVVIEHRDRSASYTYYYKSKEAAEVDNRTPIDVKPLIRLGGGHYEERNGQVCKRVDECCQLLDFLINLNNGTVPHNIMNDIKTNGKISFKLQDLVGNLDLDSLTMAGHSFGGATAFLAMSKRKEFKQGILLDPWMFPIKDENNLKTNVTQPLLCINTQTFHNPPNVNEMKKYFTSEHREMHTILHTTHEHQTDTVFTLGSWLNWFMKKLDPLVALRINNALMLRFLKKCTGHTESIEDFELYLRKQNTNIVTGLTKPWGQNS